MAVAGSTHAHQRHAVVRRSDRHGAERQLCDVQLTRAAAGRVKPLVRLLPCRANWKSRPRAVGRAFGFGARKPDLHLNLIARGACGARRPRPLLATSASQWAERPTRFKRPSSGPIRYCFFGRSVFATVGAKLAGRPGGFTTRTFFGFFASLLPCWPLVMLCTPNHDWVLMVRAAAWRPPRVAEHHGLRVRASP